MINQRTIFEIHRLAHDGLSIRRIAKTLGINRQSVQKYLRDPSCNFTNYLAVIFTLYLA